MFDMTRKTATNNDFTVPVGIKTKLEKFLAAEVRVTDLVVATAAVAVRRVLCF